MADNHENRNWSSERVLEHARKIISHEHQAIETVLQSLDERFCKAVQLIERSAGSVIVSGIGKAGIIGQKITATLASTGTRSHFLHPAEAIHGDLGRIGPDDVVLILSYSGETEEIVRLLRPVQSFGASIIAITASEDNTLGQVAEVVLPLGKHLEADQHNLAPSTSTTLMLVLGDALALVLSAKQGFQAESFARFHPGGSLGRKLSLVEEYMRPIHECRVAPDTETVRQIFVRHRLPGRRSGAVLLTDQNGALSGIFTDSDLARLFEGHHDSLLDKPISEVMTQSPTTVMQGSKMLDAVAVMARKKISELPVLDETRLPLGMIDITDVVAEFPEYAALSENNNTKTILPLKVA